MSETEPALLGCPFCGGAPTTGTTTAGWNYVECGKCDYAIKRSIFSTQGTPAVTAWNTRAPHLPEWQSPDDSPPTDYANDEAVKWHFEASVDVEALITMRMRKQVKTMRDGGMQHVDWISYGYNILIRPDSPSKVLGWRPLSPQEEETP
jgi:hypothetical protein